ncbi:MAG: TIGR03808 family TAT-translocated repetitive protein, partial [Hyphomicrobiaceae bacterium]
ASSLDRRTLLTTGLMAGAGATAALTTGPRHAQAAGSANPLGLDARAAGLKPVPAGSKGGPDQSAAFQRAVRTAATTGQPLLLAPGRYWIANIELPSNIHIIGAPGHTVLSYTGTGSMFRARDAHNIRLDGIVIDGANRPISPAKGDALLVINQCNNVHLASLTITNSLLNGVSLRLSQATIADCTIRECGNTGLFSLDARDTRILHNVVEHCGNNGIQVWRSDDGEDGTVVTGNTVRHIKDRSGGTGQNGNGINIFRANDVQVNNNRVTDCTFSAIRGNAASNIQMVGNHCLRLGEVALYAEFGFEGALIANNLIDHAATGISVTNFNDGGRLAVVQGNLIRNLVLRKHTIDTRGTGIGVEADTAVLGNVIENAGSYGIAIGWGRYMRDVSATSNIIRKARIGIAISDHKAAGSVFVTSNMLAHTPDGAIRMMNHHTPKGPDLARASADRQTNYTVFGNVTV